MATAIEGSIKERAMEDHGKHCEVVLHKVQHKSDDLMSSIKPNEKSKRYIPVDVDHDDVVQNPSMNLEFLTLFRGP